VDTTPLTILVPSAASALAPAAFAHGGIPFAFPGLPKVRCLFSTVLAGNMALWPDLTPQERAEAVAAREKLLDVNGLTHWVELHQVHGDALLVEPEHTAVRTASSLEADGACTRQSGLALVVKSADCQPVLLTDIRGSAVAALLVGWRGIAIGFPTSGVAKFCDFCGVSPAEVLAVRGPSLGPAAAEFVNFDSEWPEAFQPWFNRHSRTMDLWTLTRHQLEQAGVLPKHIFSLDLCTYTLPGLFFSYRRGDAGRQASLIWIA
jgi:YfiH family protein